ncbi:MAG: hypothetical protein LBD76_03625 [Prevotellaceae bacterium]|jgi:hypothetical protein|nr:hypothetical protein [Prevotellaceae bacterium]
MLDIEDWAISGMATIVVARKHVSENLTFGVYLVDLMCLGVKKTIFKYNAPEKDLQRIHQNAISQNIMFEEVPYELVHNIIYSAIEYAEKYGFSPVSDFTLVTQYILEEDTEAIPLIHIHCGDENGQPMYIDTGVYSPTQTKRTLEQLEKTAGSGNYHYFNGMNYY